MKRPKSEIFVEARELATMRCFFVKDGHIAGVEELPEIDAAQAIEMARKAFEARNGEFEGFEVWDGDRALYQFPEPEKASA